MIKKSVQAIDEIFHIQVSENQISLQKTNKEISGDYTLVVFPLTRLLKQSPESIGNALGNYLKENINEISSFEVIKGFLNISLNNLYWIDFLTIPLNEQHFGFTTPHDQEPVVVEFSSPNTNKPLHLGHIRNNLLGDSISRILQANGKTTIKVNLVNDRGIHICKSMLAWKLWGNGETPESSGLKGDHLVGKYYVLFDHHYKIQVEELKKKGMDAEKALNEASLIQHVKDMLVKWESGDEETIGIWKKMNSWVYDGFEKTYRTLGIEFEKTFYESDTYLYGKQIVHDGLSRGIFFRKNDGSVWVDLTEDGLDEKLILRGDGTSVYITQDLGTALLRKNEFGAARLIYVVGNEQNYHFQVLKLILKKLGYEWADQIYHLSYGMVELPEGKMKSREGTVVDADDLLDEMYNTASEITTSLGKTSELKPGEAGILFRMVSLAALKYFILKVDPVKNMLFNPAESIDFNGNTGPFVQYTHARICSLLIKSGYNKSIVIDSDLIRLMDIEKEIIKYIYDFPAVVQNAAQSLSPALIANYIYELAKSYNQFYQEIPVNKEPVADVRQFRLNLSYITADLIKIAMSLLGINVPEKM